jgi:adenylate kinase
MIKTRYGLDTASPGAILREHKKVGTPLGIEAHKLTSQGRLLPDEIIVGVAREWLTAHDGSFVFDGFPRTVGQADALEKMLAQRGTPLEVAISLELKEDVILDRVERRLYCDHCGHVVRIGLHVQDAGAPCPRCGAHSLQRRSDDSAESLPKRMREYREKSEPLISYYAERGILEPIDADREPEQVFASIVAVLDKT